MKELNELTRRLLDEGYTPEDTPPGTHPYKDYYHKTVFLTKCV